MAAMVKKITTSIVDVAKESKNKINSKYQEYKNSSNANSYDELSKELPKNYEPILNAKETQKAIWEIKNYMEQELSKELNLMRVECPLIVDEKGNVNDMLDRDGSRTPVAFKINNDGKNIINAQVLQAATKWKRLALSQFEIKENEGIYTDMRAIRKDYFLDLSHSAYVAQWDWEVNIGEEKNRNINYLFNIVQTLWKIIKNCEIFIHKKYPKLTLSQNYSLPDDIFIIHSEELYKMYPNLSRKERENQILKEKGAIFICGVGYPITDENEPHENRAADYDDWITEVEWNDGSKRRGLNGDILIWNPVTQSRHELSSMGIRVNKDSLKKQLEMCKQTDLLKESYHDAIINDKVPLSIGGGIGQSRLYTYLLRKAHVGEVEVSVWPDVLKNICKENNIHLLQ